MTDQVRTPKPGDPEPEPPEEPTEPEDAGNGEDDASTTEPSDG